MPKVSIIIPVYNVEKYLPRCLESVLGQTLQDIEVVAVDDCSPDGCAGILESFKAKDSRLKVVRHPVNHGTMWARESGLEAAEGEYFLFVDGDDAIRPEMCSTLLEKALQEDVDMVACYYEYVFADGPSTILKQSLPYGTSTHGILKALLHGDMEYNLCAKLFRREVFDSYAHLYCEGYNRSQDAAVMCMVSPHIRNAVCVDSPFYVYYQNIGSSTQKPLSARAMDNIARTNAYRLESVRDYEDLRKDAEKYCAQTLFNMVKKGHDCRAVESVAKAHGLWRVVTLRNLWWIFGNRKALTYWAVLHVNGVASLLYPNKKSVQ